MLLGLELDLSVERARSWSGGIAMGSGRWEAGKRRDGMEMQTVHGKRTYLLQLELCAPADIGVGIEGCNNATANGGGIHLEAGF